MTERFNVHNYYVDEAGDMTLHRTADGLLLGAGAVALGPEGPAAAYLKRQEDGGWIVSSNSETALSRLGDLPDKRVREVEWDGR